MNLGEHQNLGSSSFVNPYVTDGLIFHLDGEWNVAGGIHDSDVKQWRDLSPRHIVVDLEDGMEFSDKCLTTDGTSYITVSGNMSHARTWEMVVNRHNSDGAVFFCQPPDSNSPWTLIPLWNGYTYWKGITGSSSNWAINPDQIWCCSYTRDFDGTFNHWLLKNNPSSPFRTWTASGEGNETEFFIGYRGPGYTTFMKADFYCLRMYDRVLTLEEITHNWEIDKVRFGL